MAWATSDRRGRLPGNWQSIRARVVRRDGGLCTARLEDGRRCLAVGTDVDHIVPGDDHRLENLQLLCSWHHKRKTQAEAWAARMKRPRPKTRVPREEREPMPDVW